MGDVVDALGDVGNGELQFADGGVACDYVFGHIFDDVEEGLFATERVEDVHNVGDDSVQVLQFLL